MDATTRTKVNDRISIHHPTDQITFRLSPSMFRHLRQEVPEGYPEHWDIDARKQYVKLQMPVGTSLVGLTEACIRLASQDKPLHDHPPTDARIKNALARLFESVCRARCQRVL